MFKYKSSKTFLDVFLENFFENGKKILSNPINIGVLRKIKGDKIWFNCKYLHIIQYWFFDK